MRDPAAAAANFEQLLSMIEEGAVSPHIHGVYPLQDFAGALDVITSRRATGKVLLRVTG